MMIRRIKWTNKDRHRLLHRRGIGAESCYYNNVSFATTTTTRRIQLLQMPPEILSMGTNTSTSTQRNRDTMPSNMTARNYLTLTNHFDEKMKAQHSSSYHHLKNCGHSFHSNLDSQRKMTRGNDNDGNYGILPSAYKRYRDQDNNNRGRNKKNGNTGGKYNRNSSRDLKNSSPVGTRRRHRRRSRSTTAISSSASSASSWQNQDQQNSTKVANEKRKRILSLHVKDRELTELIQSYENNVQSLAFYPATFLTTDNNDNEEKGDNQSNESIEDTRAKEWVQSLAFDVDNNGSSRLIQTEDEYIKVCVHLRQLIVRWSRLHVKSRSFVSKCLSSAENMASQATENLSSSPAENALNYSILLESLRKQRANLINAAIEHERDRNTMESNSFIEWVSGSISRLASSDTSKKDDDQIQKLQSLDAHISPKYTTQLAHYVTIMRCFLHTNRGDSKKLYYENLKQLELMFSLMKRCHNMGK